MKNSHVKDFLEYYTKLKKSPEYAVLLRGKWGCGKSWFIKDFIGKNVGKKFIYVSLYGIAKFSEIEEIIFQQLNPILGSKKMKLAGTILKGTIKAAIRIDLDGDKKDDLTISPNLSNVKVPGYLKNLDKKILIFDDLERCGIPLNNILGYINQLVENNGLKVIIVANEDEIIDRFEEEGDSAKNEYSRTKEKLIGRSFDIQPDPEGAYDTFASFLSDDETKKLLIKKKRLVLDIYEASEYQNLRHIRQSIQDFELFYDFLPEKTFEKEELVEHIMKLFFLMSFELKNGLIKEGDVSMLFSRDNFRGTDRHDQALLNGIILKYNILDHGYIPIAPFIWRSFFKEGFIEKEIIEESILGSPYFNDENTPSWQKLWHFWDLEDDEFRLLVEDVYNELTNYKYDNQYEIIQVTGMLLQLNKLELVTYDENSILEIGRRNINELSKKKLLEIDNRDVNINTTSHGKQYMSLDNEKFNKFRDWIKAESNKTETDSLPDKAIELTKIFKKSVRDFGNEITLKDLRSPYFEIPILKYIPSSDFIDVVLKLSNKDLKELELIIRKRYEILGYKKSLNAETKWLAEVHDGLDTIIGTLPNTISKILIRDMLLKQIKKAIDNIIGKDAVDF